MIDIRNISHTAPTVIIHPLPDYSHYWQHHYHWLSLSPTSLSSTSWKPHLSLSPSCTISPQSHTTTSIVPTIMIVVTLLSLSLLLFLLLSSLSHYCHYHHHCHQYLIFIVVVTVIIYIYILPPLRHDNNVIWCVLNIE